MPDRRKLTSPENGCLSKGPITQAGKDRSSQNAIRHGLLARHTVLPTERRESFDASIRSYYSRIQPQDDLEESLVDDMAGAYWRIQRLSAIETYMMNREIEDQPFDHPMDRLAGAYSNLADTAKYKLLLRYDAHLHRNFNRALHNLIDLQKLPSRGEPATDNLELPNEPTL